MIFARVLIALWRIGLLRMRLSAAWAVAGAWRRCPGSIVFLAEAAALRFGDAIALHDDEGAMTFRELRAAYEDLARRLISEFAARPGVRLAIAEHNKRTFVVALLAAARTGADVILVNPCGARPMLEKALTQVYVVLHGDVALDWLSARRVALSTSSAGGSSSVTLPRLKRPGRLVLSTSGSGGWSKPLDRRPTLRSVLPTALGLLQSLPIAMHQSTVAAVPLYHGHGLATLTMALAFAAPLHIGRRHEIAPLVSRAPRAVVVSVPTLLRRWLAAGAARGSAACVVSGSAPLDPQLCSHLLDRLGPIVFNLYGSSEAGVVSLASPQMLAQAPGCVGRPLPGHAVRLDETRILVRGPLVIYARADGWLDTGDCGRIDEAGRLFVCGRSDDMIIRGGENIYPQEIEACLLDHPAVYDAAITVVADADLGQTMRALIVLRAGETSTAETLRAWLGERIDRFKIPTAVAFVNAVPRNALGKIDRRALLSIL